MKYITGIHALNLSCSLETCGDWHTSALAWKDITFNESNNSIFGDYGIECDKDIPCDTKKYYVANHIRATLDLLERKGFYHLQGLREELICNENYIMRFLAK